MKVPEPFANFDPFFRYVSKPKKLTRREKALVRFKHLPGRHNQQSHGRRGGAGGGGGSGGSSELFKEAKKHLDGLTNLDLEQRKMFESLLMDASIFANETNELRNNRIYLNGDFSDNENVRIDFYNELYSRAESVRESISNLPELDILLENIKMKYVNILDNEKMQNLIYVLRNGTTASKNSLVDFFGDSEIAKDIINFQDYRYALDLVSRQYFKQKNNAEVKVNIESENYSDTFNPNAVQERLSPYVHYPESVIVNVRVQDDNQGGTYNDVYLNGNEIAYIETTSGFGFPEKYERSIADATYIHEYGHHLETTKVGAKLISENFTRLRVGDDEMRSFVEDHKAMTQPTIGKQVSGVYNMPNSYSETIYHTRTKNAEYFASEVISVMLEYTFGSSFRDDKATGERSQTRPKLIEYAKNNPEAFRHLYQFLNY